jgi:DNA-binding NarL/FixJ family response regulator
MAALLSKHQDISIVKTFSSSKQFLTESDSLVFDILLSDLHMPEMNGLEVAEELQKRNHPSKIILLTMQRGVRFLQKAEKSGVKGYFLKNISIDDLVNNIRKINLGEVIFDETLRVISQEDDIHIKSTITVNDQPSDLLSEREKEILVLVCKEFASSQIAEQLHISVGTVDTHRKNILIKLGVNNTVGLVKYALKHRLLD